VISDSDIGRAAQLLVKRCGADAQSWLFYGLMNCSTKATSTA
jgi:hypothetical protein